MSLNRAVLVLNASYLPVNVVAVRRALTLLVKGAAEIQDASPFFVHTASKTIPMPSVIRLLYYARLPKSTRAVSRRDIMRRDRKRCMYCGVTVGPSTFTLDHVRPKSRGGESTWQNLVTACKPCNNKKSDRTPEEAGMPLIRKPHRMLLQTKHRLLAEDSAWEKYLLC